MYRFKFPAIALLVGILLFAGCQGGVENPTTPPSDLTQVPARDQAIQPENTYLMGFYDIYFDIEEGSFETVGNRNTNFTLNIVAFLNKMLIPPNGITFDSIVIHNDDPSFIGVDVEFSIHHPFPGYDQYNAYDLRGVVIGNGADILDYGNLRTSLHGTDLWMKNPDGYTRWFNPTEFTTDLIFGYTPGGFQNLAGDANVNPYKYYGKHLGKDDNFWSWLTGGVHFDGIFESGSGRTMELEFPMPPEGIGIMFGYAVVVCWEEQGPTGPYTPYHIPEAVAVSVSQTPDVWYDGVDSGGDLILDIDLFAWEHQPSTVKIESSVLDGIAEFDAETYGQPLMDHVSTYHVEATAKPLDTTEGHEAWIIAEYDGFDYSNGLPDIPHAEGSLAAFFRYDLYIGDEELVTIPIPQNLINVTTPGVVNLFWDPVVWADLAGYNVYRKLSIEAEYDFETPLNGTVLTDPDYIDTDIEVDGTIYNYVVTAVDIDTTESSPSNETTANPVYNGPVGFDSCAAAGIVKLFWDPVLPPPELDGYNIYRKESTEPDYDFGTPLNAVPIPRTFYYDNTVLMDGTTYNYVATAVSTDPIESLPSNETSATSLYTAPAGFTDMDNPDGTMGSTNVSNIINAAIHPDGSVNLAWDASGVQGVRFVRGNLEDGTWSSQVTVSGYPTDQPDIAVDSEGVAHLLFSNYYNYNRKYYYATVDLDNNVENYTEVYAFTAVSNTRLEPTIAIDRDDEVHMVFPGNDGTACLMYVHGKDPSDFSTAENITTNVYSLEFWIQPDLATDHFGNVHLIWRASSSALRYMYRNTDGTWSTPVTANASVGGYPVYPKIAVDNVGDVHIAWHSISTVGYVNNRSGSFQGMVIPGSASTNHIGLALDRDGNAYLSSYQSSGMIVYVYLIDRDSNFIQSAQVNNDSPLQGAWPTFAGNIDPCWTSNTSTIAFWKLYPTPYAPPKFARIQTDY